jgi:hypothetical protein
MIGENMTQFDIPKPLQEFGISLRHWSISCLMLLQNLHQAIAELQK